MTRRIIATVIIPSRGRPARLTTAVRSLLDHARDPDQIEIVVRADDDDPGTAEVARALPRTRVIVGPRGAGYRDLHVWINEIAARTTSRWLWIFNDDARIHSATRPWDEILAGDQTRLTYVKFDECRREPDDPALFPIVGRDVYDTLGHLSLNPHVDSWVDEVIRVLSGGAVRYYDAVTVDHSRPDDATAAESTAAYPDTSLAFCSPAMWAARQIDAATIKAARVALRDSTP